MRQKQTNEMQIRRNSALIHSVRRFIGLFPLLLSSVHSLFHLRDQRFPCDLNTNSTLFELSILFIHQRLLSGAVCVVPADFKSPAKTEGAQKISPASTFTQVSATVGNHGNVVCAGVVLTAAVV